MTALIGAIFGAMFGGGLLLAISVGTREWIRAATRHTSAMLKVDVATLSWTVAGAVGGTFLVTLLRGAQASLFGCLIGGFVAAFIRQQHLSTQKQQLHIRQSLLTPAFLDMLAISMATGIGLRVAMSNLLPKLDCDLQQLWLPLTSEGEVAVVDRLQHVIKGCEHSPTQRVANALIVSTERGTPIVDVLQSLAQEIRAECRRQLLEIAAKKDVQMMLPVVFGILPSITAVALFPAVGSLTSLT